MTVKPDPPPQVEVRRIGSSATAASTAFQLFAAQTLPAGSTATSVSIWMLPLWNTMDGIAGLRAGGMPLGLGPGHQDDAATPKVGDPDVVIAVDGHAPRHVDRACRR